LGFDRETSKVEYLHHIRPGLDFRIKFMHEKKEGTKLASGGVYDRNLITTANGLVDEFEQFRAVVFELPERIDYDSDILDAGLEASGDGWTAGLTYTFQNFENNINTLRWDNPFRATARVSGGGALQRLRGLASSAGIMDLPPDMYSHAGTLTGSVELPMSSRFTGTVSVGGTWQEDPLIPYSANTAMVTDVAATPATTLARPRSSLDGFVMNFVQNYVLTSNPVEPLTITARYRYYYYDNKTDQIDFPGYAELADSQWHAGDVVTKTPSWRRQDAGLEADYEVTSAVSVRGVYGWEQVNRQGRNVEETNEHTVGAGVTLRPAPWVKALVDYRWSNRDAGAYTAGLAQSAEAESSRQWDQHDRSRHDVKASATMGLMEALELCLDTAYVYDSYNTDRLGLRRAYGWEAGAELTYTPAEFITITANYSHEDYRSRINGGAKSSVAAPEAAGDFSDAGFFHTKTTDRADNAGVSVDGVIMPGRLEFETGYNYTRGKGRLYTFNPNGLTPDVTRSSAVALPYDDTKTVNHEVRAGLTYRFLKHFAVRLRYLYENFEVDDPSWKNLGNQIATASETLSATTAVTSETSRVALLNSQYSDYQAHVGAVLFSYIF
jgi:MtrB/PioB family decaheme-associated outer membrane protein